LNTDEFFASRKLIARLALQLFNRAFRIELIESWILRRCDCALRSFVFVPTFVVFCIAALQRATYNAAHA